MRNKHLLYISLDKRFLNDYICSLLFLLPAPMKRQALNRIHSFFIKNLNMPALPINVERERERERVLPT